MALPHWSSLQSKPPVLNPRLFFARDPAARPEALSFWFRTLRSLGVLSLVESPCLNRLQRLDLRGNDIRDTGVKILASASTLGTLRHLNLRDNQITQDVVPILVQSPVFQQLTFLDLRDNAIDTLKGLPPTCHIEL